MRTRSLGILVLALILVLAACGDSGEPAEPAPAPTAPTTAPALEPSDTTTPTTPTTPAGPPTTSTATTTTTTLPEPQPAAGPIGYRVVGVAADDVLNVRAGPSAGDPIVGTLAPDATGVVVTDTYRHEPWWGVLLADGITGWAHSRYLALDPRWSAPFGELACADAAVMGVAPQRSPAATSNSSFVDGFEFLSGPDCDRLVVRLATRDGIAAESWEWPSRAADRVPGGVTVATDTNHVLIELPIDVHPAAAAGSFDGALLLVADPQLTEATTASTAHLIYGSERVAHARFLADPARIVVDVRPHPDQSGVDLSPVAHGGVFLTEPARWDGTLPGTRQPLTVTGLGHAYEASLFISLERVDGGPAEASWTGGWGPTDPGSTYSVMSSADFFVGSFAFTMDGLDPGDYVLSMEGECMADEVGEDACAAAVLHHPFTVHDDAGTAADALAPFFAAAERLDREIAAAAAAFNAGYDAEAGTVSLVAQDAIRALRPTGVTGAIPPGMSADLERAVLAVYADLDSRIAALDGAIRTIPEGSTVLSMPEDVLRCLANGSGSKARFAADLATAKSLAAREPAPTAGPDSVAAGVLAVRIDVIGIWNRGCDNCGGAAYDEALPVDWEAQLIEDRVPFEAEYRGGVWRVLIYAC